MLPDEPPDELKRLAASRYQHTAWVHWTMAIDGRRRGWLEEIHHAKIRELLIHTCSRYFLLCPGYCLMPDHAHFLWMGLTESSDQRNATKFFRTGWNRILAEDGVSLQKQSYDHVLDEDERNRTEFEDTLLYILKNPERAGLVEDWQEWPFLGAVASGYPDLDTRKKFGIYCGTMWKIHHRERARLEGW